MVDPSPNTQPNEQEDWPTISLSADVQAQLDRADKFLEDYAAGRVERGVDALAIAVAHARHFAPGELVDSCCDEDETNET